MAALSTQSYNVIGDLINEASSSLENDMIGAGNETVSEAARAASPSVWSSASFWMWNCVVPLVILLGSFGNVASILVLRQLQSSASSINAYLALLAVTDTAALYCGVGQRWVKFVFGLDVFAITSWGCQLGYWTLNFSAAISAWLLVAVSVQRALCVVFPDKDKVKVTCTKGKAKVIMAATSGVLVLFYSHMLYGLVSLGNTCGITQSPDYRDFFSNVWTTLDLIVYSILPFACILASNVVLISRLVASVSNVQLMSENSGGHVTRRTKQASSTTLTVVVISLTFLVLNSPVTFFNLLSKRSGDTPVIEDAELLAFVYDLLFLFTSCNFGVNFYLYCLTGTKFRQCFQQMMTRCERTRGTSVRA